MASDASEILDNCQVDDPIDLSNWTTGIGEHKHLCHPLETVAHPNVVPGNLILITNLDNFNMGL